MKIYKLKDLDGSQYYYDKVRFFEPSTAAWHAFNSLEDEIPVPDDWSDSDRAYALQWAIKNDLIAEEDIEAYIEKDEVEKCNDQYDTLNALYLEDRIDNEPVDTTQEINDHDFEACMRKAYDLVHAKYKGQWIVTGLFSPADSDGAEDDVLLFIE
jgi:hypothetical protein